MSAWTESGEEETPPSSSLSGGASASAALPPPPAPPTAPGGAAKATFATAIERAVDSCQRGSEEALEEAFLEGVKATDVDGDGCSLLHWAAINNHGPIIDRLVCLGADVNYLGGILHSSPLHWAARVGHLYACAKLVKAGALIDIRDTQGLTPMHLAVQSCYIPIVLYFIDHYEMAVDLTDNSGMTPVMWCAFRSFEMFPLRLLVRAGADLAKKESLQGFSALHFAAQERNLVAVKELLAGGADILIKNNQQETALDIARNARNAKMIQMMEKEGRRTGQLPSSICVRLADSQTLRRYLEVLGPACALGSAAVLFHTVHPLIALAALLLFLLVCRLSLDFHSITHSLLPVGITVAEGSAVLITWSLSMHWWVPWWAQLAFVFFSATLIFSFVRCVLCDAGTIPPSTRPYADFVQIVDEKRLHYFCYSCFVNRPTGSKHCSMCDRCVRDFDHHCPWLNACITRKNQREFLLFVLSVDILSILLVASTVAFFVFELREMTFVDFALEFPWPIFAAALASIHVILMTSLFCVQVVQIANGVTTNQRLKQRSMHRHHGNSSGPRTEGEAEAGGLPHSAAQEESRCLFSLRNLLNFCAGN